MKRVLKGNVGYINYKKRKQLIYSLLGIIVIVAIVLIGIKINGNRNNVFTVIAAVTAIPTGKALVGLFMFIRYRSVNKDTVKKVEAMAKGLLPIYDLLLSTKEKTFHGDYALVALNNIIIFTDSKVTDFSKYEKEIEKFLKVEDIKVKVQFFTDEKLFSKRADSLNNNLSLSVEDKEQLITIANKLLILNI